MAKPLEIKDFFESPMLILEIIMGAAIAYALLSKLFGARSIKN